MPAWHWWRPHLKANEAKEAAAAHHPAPARLFAKRIRPADLSEYLNSYLGIDPFPSPNQCRILIQALYMVRDWLLPWHDAGLAQPFVHDLLTISTTALRLLDENTKELSCTSTSCLMRALAKEENRLEFAVALTGFVQAMKGFIAVQTGTDYSASPTSGIGINCIKEAKSVVKALTALSANLPLAAAEDRLALISWCIKSAADCEKQEEKAALLLLQRRLKDNQKHQEALLLDSSHLKLGKRLGSGACSVVFEATWMDLSIAVKQYHNKKNLELELEALWSLTHVNIMHVIGYTLEGKGSEPCLLMERMHGDLHCFTEQLTADIPLSVLIEILLQIATGMAYLHERHIVHRDLKPENILFNRWPPMSSKELLDGPGDFTVKIADLGASRTHTFQTTTATPKCGTACYRAPEVLQAADMKGHVRYSHKADIFSFAMVCYKLLTRSDPPLSWQQVVQGDRPEMPSQSSYPRAFVFLMKRCWAHTPQERPSFLEICDFLALFKSIVLATAAPFTTGCELPLFPRMRDEILVKMVTFLEKQWLVEEANALNMNVESTEDIGQLRVLIGDRLAILRRRDRGMSVWPTCLQLLGRTSRVCRNLLLGLLIAIVAVVIAVAITITAIAVVLLILGLLLLTVLIVYFPSKSSLKYLLIPAILLAIYFVGTFLKLRESKAPVEN